MTGTDTTIPTVAAAAVSITSSEEDNKGSAANVVVHVNLNLDQQQRPRSGSSSAGTSSSAPPRRIIKPAHPKQSTTIIDATVEPASNISAENADSHNKKESTMVPMKIAESPSVARELDQERYEENKKERMSSVKNRQKKEREKEKMDRRLHPAGGGTDAAKATFSANPMSRFLSVFSIYQHPEHKRYFEASPDDSLDEPSGKKQRSTNEDHADLDRSQGEIGGDFDGADDEYEMYGDIKAAPTSTMNLLVVSASAVALVAIVAWRWTRS